MSALIIPFPQRVGLEIWAGIEKGTGRPVWIVDHVNLDRSVATIAIVYSAADARAIMRSWYGGGAT